MKSLYCDICKKEISEPVAGRNYFHIREFDICEPCKDAVDARLRPVLRGHYPFSTDWYEQEVISFIEKGCASGRA
ncbi:MAG: hypothetical protein IAA96_04090 [Spirochaetes bacterium]|uniref:Uncharacterized protein n=1 Tax=Candidatus Avitreponema avistercoris TaxID=2840705 RepID=A0A9D9ELY6_9SPIR|nr:hypothetical protein [Candidatus Avitreponema avistercoris]